LPDSVVVFACSAVGLLDLAAGFFGIQILALVGFVGVHSLICWVWFVGFYLVPLS